MPIPDMAELAARLGSPVIFDRRGDVAWIDSFEAGLRAWDTAGSPAGHSETISTAYAFHGGYSAALATAASAGGTASIFHTRPWIAERDFGLEHLVSLDGNCRYWRMSWVFWTGTERVEFAIRVAPIAATIEYLDSDGNWTGLASSVTTSQTVGVFNPFKLALDLTAREYKRLVYGDGEADMTNLGARVTSVVASEASEITLEVTTDVDEASVAYVDVVICTLNEP